VFFDERNIRLTRPLKILVGANVPSDPDSGAAGTVYQTNRALRELGHEVDEIWADDLGRRIRHGNLHYLAELPFRFRDVVRERCARKNYDVVQLSQPHAYLVAKDLRKSRYGGVFVNRSHGLELRVNAEIKPWLDLYDPSRSFFRKAGTRAFRTLLDRQWRIMAKESDGIILPCCDDRDYLLTKLHLPTSKVRAIHHGVAREVMPVRFMPKDNAAFKRILYVGQFAFFKGPHVLVRVINKVLMEQQGMSFTWVCGKEHHANIRRMLDDRIGERVQLLEWMSQKELADVYASHGLFIYPSYVEGAGKASLEAMAHGLCVVASDTSGMRDYIRNGKNGYLVSVGDIAAFSEVICRTQKDSEGAAAMARKAAEDAREYTWSKCATESVEFYSELTHQKASQR